MDPKKPIITPDNLDQFVGSIADIYRSLEDDLFMMVAKRLKNPRPVLDDIDYVLQWQAEKMQELRMLNQETIKRLSKATGLAESQIRKAIEDVGFATIDSVDDELSYQFKPKPIPPHINIILSAYVNQVFREIDNYVNQTLITTNFGEGTVSKMYRNIVEETTAKVLAGTSTINKAVAETVTKWSNKGIQTGFVDKGGHIWTLERYAETVVRSTVNRTYNELRISRMDEYGVDLVLVSTVPDPRPACSHIQGKVACIKRPQENHSKYPSIYEFGYGTPGGLRGVNCRHMFYPYIDGVNVNNQPQYDEATMKRNREISQKQKYYERQIKKAERSLKLAEEIGDPDTINRYRKLVGSRRLRLREFKEENRIKYVRP